MALSASAGRGAQAEKVRRIKFSEDQISAILDEVFRTYAEFILPGGSGLSPARPAPDLR
jgi:hypothetical protein